MERITNPLKIEHISNNIQHTMYLRLPLPLFSFLLAAIPAQAETAPQDGSNIDVTQSVSYQIETDTTYEQSRFIINPAAEIRELFLSFTGSGTQTLTLNRQNQNTSQIFPEQNLNLEQFFLTFSDLKELRFEGGSILRSTDTGTTGNINDISVTIMNIQGDVLMENCVLAAPTSAGKQGVISICPTKKGEILINNIGGKLSISNNTASGEMVVQNGLGLTIKSHTNQTNDALIEISDILGGIEICNNNTNSTEGIGILSIWNPTRDGTNTISLKNIQGGILFENNKMPSQYARGSCITIGAAVVESYSPYTVTSADGHLSISSIEGDVIFNQNEGGIGGAIFIDGRDLQFAIEDIDGNVKFTHNRANYSGGAIVLQTGRASENNLFSIARVNGDVLFENNTTAGYGGAIYSIGSKSIEPESTGTCMRMVLHADYGDIVFQGNMMRDSLEENNLAIANSIFATGDHALEFGAKTGRKIAFYDPVYVYGSSASMVDFNKEEGQNGKILFSGEYWMNSDYANQDYSHSEFGDNYTSNLENIDVVQHRGTVHLACKAALDVKSYTQHAGELMMGRDTRLLSAGDVTLETLTVDLVSAGNAAGLIQSESGTVSVSNFSVFGSKSDIIPGTIVLSIRAASYEGILKESNTSTITMKDGYGMEYEVNAAWELAGTGEQGDLSLSLGNIVKEGVIGELRGSNVANSMISSASTLNAFTGAALNHLNEARFLSPLKSNVWTSGLGDFQMQRTENGIEGFDYQGGGFAVGGDYKLGEQWLGGVAYGYTSGKNISREYRAVNRQNTNMGLLYAGWRLPLDTKGQALSITTAASFSSSSNRLSSVSTEGQNSSGSWTNQAWEGTVKAAWNLPVGKNLVLTPYIGMEYTDVAQEAFGETGEMARRFDRGHYRNLALPLGLSLTQGMRLGGMSWSHTVSLEYLPDVYRSNAETQARLLSRGHAWKVAGSKPARQGVRASIFGRLQMTDNWSAYANYQVEARDCFVNQRVMLGLGYSF